MPPKKKFRFTTKKKISKHEKSGESQSTADNSKQPELMGTSNAVMTLLADPLKKVQHFYNNLKGSKTEQCISTAGFFETIVKKETANTHTPCKRSLPLPPFSMQILSN